MRHGNGHGSCLARSGKMTQKLIAVLLATCALFGSWAETETIGTCDWSYFISGEEAVVVGVSSDTRSIVIPSMLGGRPVTLIAE